MLSGLLRKISFRILNDLAFQMLKAQSWVAYGLRSKVTLTLAGASANGLGVKLAYVR
jgi:hypothetical protein